MFHTIVKGLRDEEWEHLPPPAVKVFPVPVDGSDNLRRLKIRLHTGVESCG